MSMPMTRKKRRKSDMNIFCDVFYVVDNRERQQLFVDCEVVY
jgi:hypothetical protein